MVYIKLNRRHVASILFFFSITLLTVCAVFIFILFNAKSFLIEELPKESNNGNRKSLEIFYNEKQGITRIKDKNFRKQSIDYNFNVFNKTDDNMRNSPPHTTNTDDSDIKNILVTPTKSSQKEKINQIKSATQLQYEVSGVSSESEETIYIDDFELRSPYIAHPNQDDLKRKEQIHDFKSSEMLPGGDKSSIGIILNTKIQKNALENSDPSKFLKNYEQNKNAFRRNRLRDSKIHSGLGQHPAITAIDDEDLTLTSSGSGDFETVNQMLSGHYDYENIPNIADKKTKAKSNRRIRLNSISYPLNNEQRNRKQKKMFLKSKCKSLSNRSNCLNKRNNSTDVSTDTELSISKSNFSTNYQLRELKNIPTHQRSISKNMVKSKNLYDTIDGASKIGNSRINSTNNSMEIKTRRVMGNFKKSKERSRQLLLCEEAGGGELCRMLFKDNEIE